MFVLVGLVRLGVFNCCELCFCLLYSFGVSVVIGGCCGLIVLLLTLLLMLWLLFDCL